MATYKAQINAEYPGLTLLNGHNAVLLVAEDATDARSLLDAITQGHPSATAWANATITLVTEGDLSPMVDPHGGADVPFTCTITIAGGTVNATFTHTATAGQSFVDVMTAMVTLLNAHASIANAAWSSPNLTVAGVADNIGDHTVTASFKLGDQEIESVIGTITDGGSAGAALAVAMSAGVRAPTLQFYRA